MIKKWKIWHQAGRIIVKLKTVCIPIIWRTYRINQDAGMAIRLVSFEIMKTED